MTSLASALDSGVDREALRLDLWCRSAKLYQAAGARLQAAEAWLEADDKNVAAELFSAVDDNFRAAELFYDCGRFSEVVICAERCRGSLTVKDFFRQVAMNLVQAAALLKLDQAVAAGDLLRGVRKELSEFAADSPGSRSQAGQAWESLARYGVRVDRSDLVRLGYEKALLVYGSDFNLQCLRCADDYLDAVAADKILTADLKSRITELKRDFKRKDVKKIL
jgi:hypothetical protein